MSKTAKELVVITRGLMGENGRAYPSGREIISACGEKGSARRAADALLTVRIERGITPHLLDQLPDDFKAVLAAAQVPTMVPRFDTVVGLPKEALELVQTAIVHAGVLVERQQVAILDTRRAEQAAWEEETQQLALQVRELAEDLDETRRASREADAAHAAALSALREQVGVLTTEVTFTVTARDAATRRVAQLEADLLASRAAVEREVERCRAAETRVATLEARHATREELEAKHAAGSPNTRAQRVRKPKAA